MSPFFGTPSPGSLQVQRSAAQRTVWFPVTPNQRTLSLSAVRLVVYTKPTCPLCDGVVSKLEAAKSKSQFQPGFWSDAEITVQDITTDSELLARWDVEVPVVMWEHEGQLVELPRQAPRLSADRLAGRLEQYIAKASDA